MSEKDVVENVDSPGEIAIPIADNTTPGIASFDSKDFTVDTNGKVSSIVERGIPQYLGKITGTGTGTTDLNWEVDVNTVKQNKPIKLGEYIMLTEHFNQFVPGDIFRITNVQIEGSKYTVKTNNVRALSLASIVGPQGEQGVEGEQGVPYLAYTSNIESTTDPAAGVLMYLEDGSFNRTPVVKQGEYRDVVTVDWYNKTTHRAFMVTGLIQYKDSTTNQWAAQITAATDITGAVGPQGKEGAGIADIVDIDYPHGEFISVQYDTTDGIKMQGIAEYLRDDGETYQIPTDIDVPLVAGPGLSIDKKETKKQVEIKSLNSNLENGEGQGSVKMSLSYCSSKGAFAFATGYYTSADADSSYAGGYYSKTNVQYSIAYGFSTRTENGVLAAFGEYNNPTAGDVLEVGNGNSNSRSNAFVVRKDGRAKVKTAPIEADDVVRKQELDKKVNSTSLANIVYATNSSSSSASVIYSKDALINSIAQRTANGRLKAADGVADDDLATVKQLNAANGGEAVTPSTATPTATSGTFTSTEWAKLQANNNNYILFNNEIYRLADKAHSGTTGIWSYTHTGWDGTAIMDKSINVTVSTGAWTLVVGQASGGVQFVELTAGQTLTSEQLDILQANKSNQIAYTDGSKVYYFKMAVDLRDGEYLYESFNDSTVTLRVNIIKGTATFNTAGGKLYSHLVQVTFNFDDKASVYMKIPLYSPSNSSINTIEKLVKYFPDYYEPGRYAFLDGHNSKYAVFLLGINSHTTQPFTTYCKTGDDITFDGYSSYSINSTQITEL